MKTSEILTKARVLIERPERWTKGANARDKTGLPVSSASKKAVCFCVAGAIERTTRDATKASVAFRTLWKAIGTCPFEYNDKRRSNKAVLSALTKAIELAQSRND